MSMGIPRTLFELLLRRFAQTLPRAVYCANRGRSATHQSLLWLYNEHHGWTDRYRLWCGKTDRLVRCGGVQEEGLQGCGCGSIT